MIGLHKHFKTKQEYQEIQRKLLLHYDSNGRVLPWRKTGKVESEVEQQQRAYEVWVSEIMLQQTRVEKVKQYYSAWLKRFPTLKVLSESTLDDVHSVWSGMGYYSRATRLREGARLVMDEHEGIIPSSPSKLQELPGIGPYTSGAILSIAFNLNFPLVDGNVMRVLSRVFQLRSDITLKVVQKHFWTWAELLVQETERPGDLNQALMDIGSLVCLPSSPRCNECPLEKDCESRKVRQSFHDLNDTDKQALLITFDTADQCSLSLCASFAGNPATIEDLEDWFKPSRYPPPKRKKAPREENCYYFALRNEMGHYLLQKNGSKGLLANMFELPHIIGVDKENEESETHLYTVMQGVMEVYPGTKVVKILKDSNSTVHKFSHIHRNMIVTRVEIKTGAVQPIDELVEFKTNKGVSFIWISETALAAEFASTKNTFAFPVTLRKCLHFIK